MTLNRRDFLQNAARAALFPTVAVHLPVLGHAVPAAAKPDIALRIEATSLDIGPGVSIRTIAKKRARRASAQVIAISIEAAG